MSHQLELGQQEKGGLEELLVVIKRDAFCRARGQSRALLRQCPRWPVKRKRTQEPGLKILIRQGLITPPRCGRELPGNSARTSAAETLNDQSQTLPRWLIREYDFVIVWIHEGKDRVEMTCVILFFGQWEYLTSANGCSSYSISLELRWPLGKRAGEVLRVQVDPKGRPFIRSSKQMTDLKTTTTLVFEASKYQTARHKQLVLMANVLKRCEDLDRSPSCRQPHSKNLRERYTLGTLSCIALDVAAKRKTLDQLQYLNLVSTFTEQVQLLQTNPGKEPASKVFGVEIKDSAESTLNMLNANPSRFTEPMPYARHIHKAMANESLICGINGPLAHHFTIVAILPVSTFPAMRAKRHQSHTRSMKFLRGVGYQATGSRVQNMSEGLLRLDVTTKNGADGVIFGGFG
ncbi:hypothetical protein ARMSODRAFT_1061484 [Armillaria solidipes]|uniref:Uncharacterized protein n=1 Tax=Armillaria solidipes TaxID=1076256 RepID=A0A2H3AU65_9AGAR|nr:hypothetical protein ARMSODRAFT_1061484 [Armillaria solidipes]